MLAARTMSDPSNAAPLSLATSTLGAVTVTVERERVPPINRLPAAKLESSPALRNRVFDRVPEDVATLPSH